jgi:hypothetical protein
MLLALAGCAGSSGEPGPGEATHDTGGRPVEAAFTTAAVGKTAPDFELDWLDRDGEATLADLRGRVVLLEFWRTY